ncbi:hypothetical protein PsorP6_003303 [Peronosclerospora sorghi]|uniref:Uncharacterized protein n=1 Tax=Peronosclerospora sorghi TaxID=230839 RepID=A0ACC0VPM3_9STRA|nr:hypothetical protein PsorP6_003303 [Peronosclerospora sorghi]
MNIPIFRASQVCGKTVAGAIDPSLWQLSGTERAQAVKNYFPSNYEASVRKEVYPVVANLTHLLRSQPRALMNRNAGARVGYSCRSLVRQIHNIEGELEADVNQMEKKMDAVDVNGKADDGVCSPVTVFSEHDGKNECDESFASMKTFDMHFSPPFFDSATQSVKDGAQANDATLVSSHQTSSATSSTSVSGSPHF